MFDPSCPSSRRAALSGIGTLTAVAAIVPTMAMATNGSAQPSFDTSPANPGGRHATGAALAVLARHLASLPRRRSFSRVPFLVDRPELWDHEAAAALLAYRAGPKQVWENSELGAAWLNLMREAVNGQVFAHDHADFLAVSATHGSAHLALFNEAMWDKYALSSRTGGIASRNVFVDERPGATPSDDRQDLHGFYGPQNNNVVSLQRRGVVFVGCHDTVHGTARALSNSYPGSDPDAIAAELTNNLIPGVILVPSVVAYLAELQLAGFTYAKGA